MASVVARAALGVAVVVTLAASVPGAVDLARHQQLGLLGLSAAACVLVLVVAERGDDRAVLWSLRAFVLLGLSTVVWGVVAVDGGTQAAFLGFVLVLSAVTLPPREHLLASALAAAVLGAITLDGRPTLLWSLLPALAVGLLAYACSRTHALALVELERERATATSASGALRAVVEAAGAATTADVDDVLDAVTRATERIGSDTAGLYLLGPDGRMRYGATHGLPREMVDRVFEPDEGLAGQVLLTGTTVVVGAYDTYPHAMRDYPHAHRLRGAIGAPIRVGGEIVGALVAGRFGPDPYDAVTITAFELLAVHAGRAIALARAIGEDRATLAQLQRLEHMQEDFVSTVSHELRTPLAVIDGAAQTLVELGDGLGPSVRSSLLERISSNVRSLDQAVTSILEMARLDRGLAEFSPDEVDLAELAERCVERLAPVLADHDVRLDVVVARAVGDAALLERVVDNLVLNAATHTPAGTTIEISVRRHGDRVEVAVRDDGPGIAAHELAYITERFRRATSAGSRGLGIGLALTDQVLALHGTRLEITSTVGTGSTFAFRLATGDEAERSDPLAAVTP